MAWLLTVPVAGARAPVPASPALPHRRSTGDCEVKGRWGGNDEAGADKWLNILSLMPCCSLLLQSENFNSVMANFGLDPSAGASAMAQGNGMELLHCNDGEVISYYGPSQPP